MIFLEYHIICIIASFGPGAPIVPLPDLRPPWSEASPTDHNEIEMATAPQRKHLQPIKVRHTDVWTHSWKIYQDRVIGPPIAQTGPILDKKTLLERHTRYWKKAKNALAIQIRIGKTGRADFLHECHVQGCIVSPCLPLWM